MIEEECHPAFSDFFQTIDGCINIMYTPGLKTAAQRFTVIGSDIYNDSISVQARFESEYGIAA